MIQLLLFSVLAMAEGQRSAVVVSVYDGDTFTLQSGEKVRLAAVNTPELNPMELYAVEARDAAESFLMGRNVTLHMGTVERDGYGRLIAGVSVEGELLANRLLSLGLAHLFLIPPLPSTLDLDTLLASQMAAKEAARGIWSTDGYRGDLHITSFHANAAGDDRENVNGEYLRVCNITGHPIQLEGYALENHSGGRWTLPDITLPSGHTVKIHSGQGPHQVDAREQLAIFLGSDSPIWNNRYSKAILYNRYGQVMDVRIHQVQGY